jgi:hypothetical protein
MGFQSGVSHEQSMEGQAFRLAKKDRQDACSTKAITTCLMAQ